jgi:hypothetical protein
MALLAFFLSWVTIQGLCEPLEDRRCYKDNKDNIKTAQVIR